MSTVPAKRRKSEPTISSTKPSSSKKPRLTLDTFFTREISGSDVPTLNDKAATALPKLETFILSPEQNSVLGAVKEGQNVFFTGAAGTGKSLLLRYIIESLRKKHSKHPDSVAITASTGMAAANIGGMTLHAWGAVAPGTQDIDTLISYIRVCRPALQRWKKVKVLVIDEISMVDASLFERLCGIADKLRKKTNKSFGGIQLIVTGDFFQLPPVSNNKMQSFPEQPFFAFESDAWKKSIDCTVNLKEVFRQKGDQELITLLNALRKGSLSLAQKARLGSLNRHLPAVIPDITPTELFPLRAQVTAANESFLSKLTGPSFTYDARDSIPEPKTPSTKVKPKSPQKLLESVMAPEKLVLKKGAQVMLVKNIDKDPLAGGNASGLVNGCVGKVVNFYAREELVRATGGKGSKSRTGVIRNVVMDADGNASLAIPAKREEKEKENQKPLPKEEHKGSIGKGKAKVVFPDMFPLVEFPVVVVEGRKRRRTTELVLICRDEFKVEDNDGNLLARRIQVPLILAWAMSIHKSQGQTIERVKVDLDRVFETGQTYVALSRVTSLEGLQVIGFNPGKVMVDPKVIEWYRAIEGEESEGEPVPGPSLVTMTSEDHTRYAATL